MALRGAWCHSFYGQDIFSSSAHRALACRPESEEEIGFSSREKLKGKQEGAVRRREEVPGRRPGTPACRFNTGP
jgi:hypothetical protein